MLTDEVSQIQEVSVQYTQLCNAYLDSESALLVETTRAGVFL